MLRFRRRLHNCVDLSERDNQSVNNWHGQFRAINSLTQLRPGYYGDLIRYLVRTPAKGGLSWDGDGRGCNTLRGWFSVDQATYESGALRSIDLRFEQHCEDATPA